MPTVQPLTLDLIGRPWLGDVPSPPHDALSPEQRRAHIQQFPMSYLGVTRAPDDFDVSPDQTAADLLVAGRRSLEQLIDNGVFEPAEGPQYFVYRLRADGHQQTGVVCGVTVGDYDQGEIRVHERVKVSRAQHLANHLAVVGAQSSPIALASRDQNGSLAELIAKATRAEPALDFFTIDGLHQHIWRVTDPDLSGRLTEAIAAEPLYLIDGHHRAAAAAQHLHGHADRDDKRPGDRWMLSTVFPAAEMRNKAFNRVAKVASPTDLLAKLQSSYGLRQVESVADVANRGDGVVAVGCAQAGRQVTWALFDLPQPSSSLNVVERLEPSRLATLILEPMLGIDESEPKGLLRYAPGLNDEDSLSQLAIGPDEVVFVMRPVTMEELFLASDNGLTMPPKSTYFEPKVRSGLFVHFKERV